MLSKEESQESIMGMSDGIVTSLGYMLPMILRHGVLDKKSIVLGAIGGGVSMASGLYDSVDGRGGMKVVVVMFIASMLGALIPSLPFLLIHNLWISVPLSVYMVLHSMLIVVSSKVSYGIPRKTAYKQVGVSFIPAIAIVSTLSLVG